MQETNYSTAKMLQPADVLFGSVYLFQCGGMIGIVIEIPIVLASAASFQNGLTTVHRTTP